MDTKGLEVQKIIQYLEILSNFRKYLFDIQTKNNYNIDIKY